ncbi:MAG: response regulator transcription factor [Pseudomonadota bacterium]
MQITSAPPVVPASSAAPIRLLLIHSQRLMRCGLEQIFASHHPHFTIVASATSCEQAQPHIASRSVDVVVLILDLQAPETAWSTRWVGSAARVLVVTAERRSAALEDAVRQGVHGIVGMDATAEEVIDAVRRVHRGELAVPPAILAKLVSRLTQPAAQQKDEAFAMAGYPDLTTRECHIVRTAVEAKGASNKELAKRLFLSEHTLRNHLSSIYQKLGIGTRLELYIYATRHRMPPADARLSVARTERAKAEGIHQRRQALGQTV